MKNNNSHQARIWTLDEVVEDILFLLDDSIEGIGIAGYSSPDFSIHHERKNRSDIDVEIITKDISDRDYYFFQKKVGELFFKYLTAGIENLKLKNWVREISGISLYLKTPKHVISPTGKEAATELPFQKLKIVYGNDPSSGHKPSYSSLQETCLNLTTVMYMLYVIGRATNDKKRLPKSVLYAKKAIKILYGNEIAPTLDERIENLKKMDLPFRLPEEQDIKNAAMAKSRPELSCLFYGKNLSGFYPLFDRFFDRNALTESLLDSPFYKGNFKQNEKRKFLSQLNMNGTPMDYLRIAYISAAQGMMERDEQLLAFSLENINKIYSILGIKESGIFNRKSPDKQLLINRIIAATAISMYTSGMYDHFYPELCLDKLYKNAYMASAVCLKRKLPTKLKL